MVRLLEDFGIVIVLVILTVFFVGIFQVAYPFFDPSVPEENYSNTSPGPILDYGGNDLNEIIEDINGQVDVNDLPGGVIDLNDSLELYFGFERKDLDHEGVFNVDLNVGVQGDSFKLKGRGDSYVQLIPENISNESTYSIWVKPHTLNSNVLSFLSDIEGEGETPYQYEHLRGNLLIGVDKKPFVKLISFDETCVDERVYVNTEAKVKVGQWNHLAFTVDFDNNFMTKLYIDGIFIGSTEGQSCSNNNNVIWIGKRKGEGYNLAGEVDEFAYWTRVLTEEEIQMLAEGVLIES